MASITSLSNSSYNASSIYGNRNVFSGLASGMDTESMIENAVSGIKLKIENLVKKRTKVEWQQEAYRSIIDKAVNFNNKYISYASKTNLLSSSFFSNAVNTAVNGTWKDKITASGKTSSDIKINAVKQMAKAATYTVSGIGGGKGDVSSITGEEFDITKDLDVSTMSGTLSFQYGGTNGTSFDIQFEELEDWDKYEGSNNAEKLANAINDKLSKITYNYTKNGFQESTTADQAIKVKADGMKITFEDGLGNGNTVSIGGASESIQNTLGLKKDAKEINLTYDTKLSETKPAYEYLGGKKDDDGKWTGGKELSVTFNGVTKKINMSDVLNEAGLGGTEDTTSGNLKFKVALQKELNDAFGAGKVTAEVGSGKLVFKTAEGSTLSLGGSAAEALGFEAGDSNYLNPGKKLTDILGEDHKFFKENRLAAVGEVDTKRMMDEAGNRVKKAEDGSYYRVNSEGKALYDFKVNGTSIAVSEDTTLESLMNSINSNAEAGVKVSYSKLTNEFKFTATETGANGKIEFGGLAKDLFANIQGRSASDNFAETFGVNFGADNTKELTFKIDGFRYTSTYNKTDTIEDVVNKLNTSGVLKSHAMTASFDELTGQLKITDKTGKPVDFKLFDGEGNSGDYEYKLPESGSSYTAGQDAVMDVEINGKRFENLTRSSNSFDIDGLTVNVKGTFEAKPAKEGEEFEAITFSTTTDTDKIVDAIRSFVDDYNEMATEIKNAYSTLPAQKSNGAKYEPLTSEQEEKYSESELKAYNEKAKQGILFGDSSLSSMYSKLLSSIAPGGTDGQTLREIGIGTSYNNGMTTLSLDEDKLRAALESDPDKVKNAFTKTKESGSATDGLMKNMQNVLDTYVKTSGEPKGVLIQRAGSMKAYNSLNNNSLKTQIDNIDKQIDRWQDKMASQIDRYTTQFSRLEQLIAEMNSQASAFAGLMGGSGGY